MQMFDITNIATCLWTWSWAGCTPVPSSQHPSDRFSCWVDKNEFQIFRYYLYISYCRYIKTNYIHFCAKLEVTLVRHYPTHTFSYVLWLESHGLSFRKDCQLLAEDTVCFVVRWVWIDNSS